MTKQLAIIIPLALVSFTCLAIILQPTGQPQAPIVTGLGSTSKGSDAIATASFRHQLQLTSEQLTALLLAVRVPLGILGGGCVLALIQAHLHPAAEAAIAVRAC